MKRTRVRALPCLVAVLAALPALQACSTAPKAPEANFETANRAAEYSRLADGFLSRGQLEEALRFYGQALDANSSVDDVAGVAAVRTSIGRAYLAAGQEEDAARELELALEYARMSGDGPATAIALAGLGELAYRGGDPTRALAIFLEASTHARDDPAAMATVEHDAATALAALDRLDEAVARLAKASAANLKARRWSELGSNRYLLASIQARQGELEKALATALEALDADRRAENGRGIAADLAAAARLAERLGRNELAYGYWRRSFDTALAVEDAQAVRKALAALAPLAGVLGRTADAERWRLSLGKLDAAEAGRP